MGSKKNFELKKWVIVSLAIFVALLIVIDIFLLLSSIKIGKKDTGEITYVYNIKQPTIDYKVLLYPNSFIEAEYLGKGESYLADLTKSIDITYNYQYVSSKKVNLHYNYKVEAIITGEYRLNSSDSSSKVWTKEYTLSEEDKDVEDIYNLNLNPSVSIDYNSYNDIVSEFRKELKLSITANLSVRLTVTVTGEVEDNKINDIKTMELVIPLNQQAFNIEENVPEEDAHTYTKQEDYVEEVNYFKLIVGGVAQVLIIILTVNFYRLALDIKPKTQYEKKKNKYLKAYGDIVVEVDSRIDEDSLQVVKVKSFEELIDLEEELRIPINFYQVPDKEMGIFTILYNHILYKYVLEVKTKKKKNK